MSYQAVRSHRQQGMALIITLVFMLILTIIGISALQSGMTESRMASNQQDYDMAFQAAEAALREGESFIAKSDASALSGLAADESICQCTPNQTYNLGHDSLSANPQFCVDEIRVVGYFSEKNGESNISRLYCIRAMGVGASDNSQVMLESRFIKVETF